MQNGVNIDKETGILGVNNDMLREGERGGGLPCWYTPVYPCTAEM
jgi:hypothetical protein